MRAPTRIASGGALPAAPRARGADVAPDTIRRQQEVAARAGGNSGQQGQVAAARVLSFSALRLRQQLCLPIHFTWQPWQAASSSAIPHPSRKAAPFCPSAPLACLDDVVALAVVEHAGVEEDAGLLMQHLRVGRSKRSVGSWPWQQSSSGRQWTHAEHPRLVRSTAASSAPRLSGRRLQLHSGSP